MSAYRYSGREKVIAAIRSAQERRACTAEELADIAIPAVRTALAAEIETLITLPAGRDQFDNGYKVGTSAAAQVARYGLPGGAR